MKLQYKNTSVRDTTMVGTFIYTEGEVKSWVRNKIEWNVKKQVWFNIGRFKVPLIYHYGLKHKLKSGEYV